MKKQSSFSRKLKKFQRDPIQFFRDTKFLKRFFKVNKIETQSIVVHTTNPVTEEITDTSVKTFTNISPNQKIVFTGLKSNKNKLSSVLLVPDNSEVFVECLLENLKTFNDFSYLRPENLPIGTFSRDMNLIKEPLTILNLIDLKNKEELSKVNNIFLLNAPSSLCKALRYSSPFLNVYNIFTEEDAFNNFEVDSITGAIFIQDSPLEFRRSLSIPSFDTLHMAMRRIVQENVLKNPNILLQIKGDIGFEPELINNNPDRAQIVIYLKTIESKSGRTFNQLLEDIDSNIDTLLVSDSVYSSYKNLCEIIEEGGSTKPFMSAALQDSVRVDIKGVK